MYLPLLLFLGEVSDSGSGSIASVGRSDDDEDSDDSDGEPEEFYDGYDDDLLGDEEDRQRMEAMTEKEREIELFNRIEKREVLKTRLGIINFFSDFLKILKKNLLSDFYWLLYSNP
jgi:hypothetical protein